MTDTLFPEIQAATQALEKRIAITEAEVTEMKEDLRTKKELLRAWRKALGTFSPKLTPKKKRAASAQPPGV